MRGPEQPDVVVVGGGPAGSTVAGILARRGWCVLVLERHRFPRPKACGECLNPGAVSVLDRLGLLPAVEELAPATIRGWDLRTGEGARASGRFGPEVRSGLALPRSELDATLLAQARVAGAVVREGIRVTAVEAARGGRRPRVRAARTGGLSTVFAPSVVVGADGLRSVVARSTGAIRRRPRLRKASLTFRVAGPGLPADRGRLHMSDEGTVGVAPVGRSGHPGTPHGGAGLWNVTVVVDSDAAAASLTGEPDEILTRALRRAAPDWRGGFERVGGPWGSGPFDWPSRPLPAPGVVLVGDAAGYFDPLTGQGIYRALRSAEMAGDAIDRTLRGSRVSGASVVRGGHRMRSEFKPGRRVQKVIETVVSSPGLRERAVRGLGAAPPLLDAVVRVTGDARPVRSLAAPGLLARLLAPGGPGRP